jgi:hypothetical protein
MRNFGEFKRKYQIFFSKYLTWCEYKKHIIIIKLLTEEWIRTSEKSCNGSDGCITLDVRFHQSEDGRHNDTMIPFILDSLDLSVV